MNISDLKLLFDYNYWATSRILEACTRITPEQFHAPADLPYGGLHTTLIHILDAEQSWRMRLQHHSDAIELTTQLLPDLESLQKYWASDEAAMRDYLASLKDEDLPGLVRYQISDTEFRERIIWHCLVHVVNHGTQHRSEAAFLTTNYGSSPGDLDFTVFLLERR